MKKLLGIIVFSLLLSGNTYADEELTINDLLKDGYKIIKQDTISANETMSALMVFTLKKRNQILICSLKVRSSGRSSVTKCNKP
tara:strand:+ start:569 stop:820 length:252 start_codon:yes stop_codon:yes gene_type:complete